MFRRVPTSVVLVAIAGMLGLTVAVASAAPPKPAKLTLNTKAKTLTVGQTFKAKVKSVKPAKAKKKVKWTSSKKKVATVNNRGLIKAVSAGTTTITAKSTVRPKVKATIKITVKKKFKPVIDPALLGRWGAYSTGLGIAHTYDAGGVWTKSVIMKAPYTPHEYFFKGYYQARNGQIHYSGVIYQGRDTDSDPWSAWQPAEPPNWIENYVVGTDEYGKYLSTEDYPTPVAPDSLKYYYSE